MLVWARKTAGYSMSQAASELDIHEERLADWESDSDASPSIPQLRKLAQLYKRPLAAFYLREVPPRFEVMRDLRRMPGTGLREFSPELELEIRYAHERRELALEMAEDLEETPAKFLLTATTNDDAETVGGKLREALGVTQQLQLQWRDQDGRAAYIAWRERLELLGVLVFQATRIGEDEASGFAIAKDMLPVIVINRKDAPVRRTFSLLHEAAHLMVRASGVSDYEPDTARPPEDQKIEVFCNHVAAAALVPKEILMANATVIAHGERATDWTDAEISGLARDFNVSRDALLRRLLTFNRTTKAFYSQKHAEYRAEFLARRRAKREKSVDMKRNMPQETVSNLGRPLVKMLLGNYYQQRLTLSEMSGYLGLKTKHFPKLEALARAR